MNFRTTLFVIIITLFARSFVFAGEGMWIPILLQQLNEKEMKEMGMKITAEDIYSINNTSMKDAIVRFGRGCTGEIISENGLLLTNHHCGFRQIQQHSSVEHDYLTDGFWAMSQEEELINPGLTATMMVSMEEVTDKVLEGVTAQMTEADRNKRIKDNASKLIEEFEKDSDYKASIRPFFNGNAFYLMATIEFKDIRLVGAPPSNIGKFGGDTDNWMWPRHTGDFSLFRIYVGKDGKPAAYSEDNVPYQPKYFFPISLKGVDEGDFTFVFGYPGRTSEYLPSDAVDLIVNERNPNKIDLRGKRLEIFNKYSDQDAKVRIQYAAKHARVSNYWKKMIGESVGINRMNGIEEKEFFEEEIGIRIYSDPALKIKYGNLLSAFENTYAELTPLQIATDYLIEAGLTIEVVDFAGAFKKLAEMSAEKSLDPKVLDPEIERLKKRSATFFKDYYQPIDEEVMSAMLQMYNDNTETTFKPEFLSLVDQKFGGDWERFTADIFKKTLFNKEEDINKILGNYKSSYYKKIEKDPVYKMYLELFTLYNIEIKPILGQLNHQLDSLQRIYMKAQMEIQSGQRFYPDANGTLRITYGNVKSYEPEDAKFYRYYTTLEGIIEKEDPEIYDYVVEDKLKELYLDKNYGQYADTDGNLRVCFIATNHTTGGNSGSPVINAEGQLVGLNFDRCWEGTMSDLMYDPEVCRNIALDVRYLLFIVDKYAGAGYLLDEMKIIN